MFKYYFEKIDNIEVFPLISLGIFFIFFLLLLLWVFRVDNKYIQKMKNLPIDKEDELNQLSIDKNIER